jgi:hypothetical protein
MGSLQTSTKEKLSENNVTYFRCLLSSVLVIEAKNSFSLSGEGVSGYDCWALFR